MSSKGKEAAQRLLAILVIIAMMMTMGIPLPVIVFFAIVIYFVWRAVQHTERQDTNRIFEFYVAANEILRDEERRWYGFEIAEVLHSGERILSEMEDPPPLVLYALGALYLRVGDAQSANEHLAQLVEQDIGDESRRLTRSSELHRYVQTLRRLEREPAEAPQTMAAMRSLERARRARAKDMLAESRALTEAQTVRAAIQNSATASIASTASSENSRTGTAKSQFQDAPVVRTSMFLSGDDDAPTIENTVHAVQTVEDFNGMNNTPQTHHAKNSHPTLHSKQVEPDTAAPTSMPPVPVVPPVPTPALTPPPHIGVIERTTRATTVNPPPSAADQNRSDRAHGYHSPQPSITEVLRRVYDEEKKTA